MRTVQLTYATFSTFRAASTIPMMKASIVSLQRRVQDLTEGGARSDVETIPGSFESP